MESQKESLLKRLVENFKPENSEEPIYDGAPSKADIIAMQYMGKVYEGQRIAEAEERASGRIYFG